MKHPKKILFLTNIIAPYMHDFFENLQKYPEVDFTVAACALTEPDRKWELDFLKDASYKYKILDDTKLFKMPFQNRFFYFGGMSLFEDIVLNNYSTVVFKGGTRFIGPFYALTAKLMGKNTVLWEEANSSGATWIKNLIKSFYINEFFFSRFIAYGTTVREYLEAINSRITDNIHFAYSPIDNNRYRQRYLKLNNKRSLIRKQLGISDKTSIILYVGRFVKEKNLFTLLQAISLIQKRNSNLVCLMVGGGNQDEQLQNYIVEKELTGYVRLIPFQQFKKLTYFYSAADLFVLPSSLEPWGLVVNEAMTFNLPVVVSDRVGSGYDLVQQGYNGYVFPYQDSQKLAEYIFKALEHKETLGFNSYKIIKDKDFDQVCRTIIAAG